MGGKEGDRHASKKLRAGRGTVGKAAVVGVKDRETNKVRARFTQGTGAKDLMPCVEENVGFGATVYTDDAKAYGPLVHLVNGYTHTAVKHSVGEFVSEQAHTNGIESFWAVLKRGHVGVYHKMSPKHLDRYVSEFAGRHNMRELDTVDQMAEVAPLNKIAQGNEDGG